MKMRALKLLMLTFLLTAFAGSVLAESVELGLNEVLLVDGQVVIFDTVNQGSLVFLRVEAGNRTYSPVLKFGENITVEGVTYTVGSFDSYTGKLRLPISGNYSSVRVLKKHDFDVELVEAFNTYVKLRIINSGFYRLNGTLQFYSQGVLLEEVPVDLKRDGSTVLKVRPLGSSLTLSMKELGISKTLFLGELKEQVSIEEIWNNGPIFIGLLNRGDPVNATVKLLYSGLTLESKKGRAEAR